MQTNSVRISVSPKVDEIEVRSAPSQSIRPSARSAHRSQLGKAGLERPHQRVDLRFGHRRGEHARTRADDAATFVVEVIEQRLESARLVGRRVGVAVISGRRLLHVHEEHRARPGDARGRARRADRAFDAVPGPIGQRV